MTAKGTSLDIDALIGDLTVEEKAALCSGHGFWHTRGIDRLSIPSVMVSDGPHGLRIQVSGGDHLGIETSKSATCFPPAVTLGSTWDVDVARRVGEAIGVEARAEGLAVVLGPGVNIKRSPLCGRNFEYFSEDPHVAAAMGTAWVHGLQSTGVGASLKHFAVNNQETDRLRVSAQVDERTLREIYLAAFEPIIRDAKPWTVMCSYNRINGTYAASDHWLLTRVLRDDWGFDGLVVSDWGAVDDPVASILAGLDLEMPGTGGVSAATIVDAVTDGSLDIAALDRAVRCVLQLVDRSSAEPDPAGFDADAHHLLARSVAAQGAVLLKNDGDVLPLQLQPGQRLVLIGELAVVPRYQGAGSSQVNPTRVDAVFDAFCETLGDDVAVDVVPGYDVDAAVESLQGADAVVIVAGLPASYESEGFDRTDMALPADQLALIQAVGEVRPDTVVVLANGSAVTVGDFDTKVAAVLECWLGGQASGSAVADLVTGGVNPSGKLTESIPLRLADTPSYLNFPGAERQVHYGEGIFVGYRHYDAAEIDVAYPFGHGLSYTTFAYSDLTLDVLDDGIDVAPGDPVIEVAATITNTGGRRGAEAVQIYVGSIGSATPRPIRELRGFTKVDLEPGKTERVNVALSRRDLSRWSTRHHDWVFDPGTYEVAVAASSRDLRLVETVEIPGPVAAEPLDGYSTMAEWLGHPKGRGVLVETMRTSPVGDLTPLLDDEATIKLVGQFPLRRLLPMLGGAFTVAELDALIERANLG